MQAEHVQPTCSLMDLAGPFSWAVQQLLLSCTSDVSMVIMMMTGIVASFSAAVCRRGAACHGQRACRLLAAVGASQLQMYSGSICMLRGATCAEY